MKKNIELNKLVRFGVSIEKKLINEFDYIINKKKYSNRSEAIRDLIRKFIIEEKEWKDADTDSIGTINIVYNHHKREISKKLTEIQHDFYNLIVSDTHVHLDHDNCLEVIIVKGKIKEIKNVADKLISIKGVKFGKFIIATKGKKI